MSQKKKTKFLCCVCGHWSLGFLQFDNNAVFSHYGPLARRTRTRTMTTGSQEINLRWNCACLHIYNSLSFRICNVLFGLACFLVHAREVPVSQARKASANQGRVVLIFLPNSISAGLYPFSSGVAGCSVKQSFTCSFSFFSAFFMVCQLALLRHWPAASLGLTSHEHSLENSSNSFEMNCGPLSDLKISGIPCLANMDFNASIVSLDFWDASSIDISMKREK